MTEPSREELLELIVESSADFAIFTMDADGVTTSWNVGAQRLFGFSEAEIVGQVADVIFTEEDQAAGVPADERRRAREDGRAIDERWHRRKGGDRFWASGLLMPLRSGAGYVKITRDRTEQHEAEQRERAKEARFRVLATNIPQLVFTTRGDGDRTWPSPQWIAFTGQSAEESIGFGWLDAIHPDDLALTRDGWVTARTTGEYHVEHRVWDAAEHEYRWHQTRARPIEDDARSGEWIGTTTDIHDLHTLKDRQAVLLAELQHRTRNLLGVVQAIARQTMRRSHSIDAFRDAYEERLRALSRVQSMLAEIDFTDLSISTIIEGELAAHFDGDLAADKVAIAGPGLMLPASAAQALALGIHELATNALKYGALAQSSGRLSVRWSYVMEGQQPTAIIDWHESGVTMPARNGTLREGYGIELITRALPYQLGARTELVFEPDGVRCTIAVPVRAEPVDVA